MTALVVLSCGPMTSLQDTGRVGSMRFGLSRSGAMDLLSLAMANALAGNEPGAAAIELMLAGATFRLDGGPTRIAVMGARMGVTIDGGKAPPATSLTVWPGQVLAVGPATAGLFGYLAVAGGLDLPAELGSLSLQGRAGIGGGFGGRPLAPTDRLPLHRREPPSGPERASDPAPLDGTRPIRVVLGPQDDYFSHEAIEQFLATDYTVSAEADRMGYRLAGPAIPHEKGFNIVSDGLVAGSIQVPGSGVPIVMMADHQTTGGYPKIATVVSADLGRVAQRRPGERVRFEAVTIETAQRLVRDHAAFVASLPDRVSPVGAGLPDSESLLGLNLAGAAADALAP